MSIADAFKSPIVWIGGGALGLVLMLRGGGGASSDTGSATVSGADPIVVSATVAMNQASLGAQVDLAEIDADVAKNRFALDAANTQTVYSFLNNANENYTRERIQQITSDAGVTNTMIAANQAVTIDAQQNTNRLGLAYIALDQTKLSTDASIDIARYQYKASKNNLIGSAISGITGAATQVGLAVAGVPIGGAFASHTALAGGVGGSSAAAANTPAIRYV